LNDINVFQEMPPIIAQVPDWGQIFPGALRPDSDGILTTAPVCSTIDGMDKTPAPAAFAGLVQVYTGNGKGKTTAALGLALRAAGHGLKTYIGQFLKGQPTGEIESLRKLAPLVRLEQFGRKEFIRVTEGVADEDVDRARDGLRKCLKAMLSGEYRIVVMDEVNTAVHLKLLSEREVLEVLGKKPADVELVLTGRYAPEAVVEKADLVTEMKDIKHYGDRGVKAREGIEK
jgi:cob(I)alamin adenosyltransferase